MGFNIRYVSKQTILETLENNGSLINLFANDSLIFEDEFSTKIHNLFRKGYKEKELIKMIKNEKQK